jgi:hypothetical protein
MTKATLMMHHLEFFGDPNDLLTSNNQESKYPSPNTKENYRNTQEEQGVRISNHQN